MAKITLHGITRYLVPDCEYKNYLICECSRGTVVWYEAISGHSDMESLSRYAFDTIEDLKKYIDKLLINAS